MLLLMFGFSLGNKQDVNGAMDTSEICDCLKLDALANTHQSLCRIVSPTKFY